ncbi:MAG TPA: chorion class high-cysteine HCB protein 13 [Candidatus Anaerobutyricum stercoripullorum]|uniref:Chorion class high-cysteine HCB protein 13 n=1 Tax=Candidatus Anaerobutyricum stercoripullorum TaxID=2838456 RepID=A0A9D1X561_9FIRM|nr:chorion class high-cysteine HCB protein 13 [Candidatus Anaerobutyricum stercoripullorum]
MSDLAATNCQARSNGCDGGFGNCLFPLLLLCCCGNGGGFSGNSDGCGYGCDIIWLLLILSCCGCGNGFGFGGGNSCCCG